MQREAHFKHLEMLARKLGASAPDGRRRCEA